MVIQGSGLGKLNGMSERTQLFDMWLDFAISLLRQTKLLRPRFVSPEGGLIIGVNIDRCRQVPVLTSVTSDHTCIFFTDCFNISPRNELLEPI